MAHRGEYQREAAALTAVAGKFGLFAGQPLRLGPAGLCSKNRLIGLTVHVQRDCRGYEQPRPYEAQDQVFDVL